MDSVKITDEHRWLQRHVGEWIMESKHATGTEVISLMGENWIIGRGSWAGEEHGAGQNILTLGFDDTRGRFVGSWAMTMMNMLWLYDGNLEANRLILECEGPSFDGSEGTSQYRDIMVLDDDRQRRLVSEVLGDDGSWSQFNEMLYTRK